MITGLDHVVIAVRDLDAAVRAYEALLGRAAVLAGRGRRRRCGGRRLRPREPRRGADRAVGRWADRRPAASRARRARGRAREPRLRRRRRRQRAPAPGAPRARSRARLRRGEHRPRERRPPPVAPDARVDGGDPRRAPLPDRARRPARGGAPGTGARRRGGPRPRRGPHARSRARRGALRRAPRSRHAARPVESRVGLAPHVLPLRRPHRGDRARSQGRRVLGAGPALGTVLARARRRGGL